MSYDYYTLNIHIFLLFFTNAWFILEILNIITRIWFNIYAIPEERYLKKSPLRVIITTFRFLIPFIWIGYLLFPNFFIQLFEIICYLAS